MRAAYQRLVSQGLLLADNSQETAVTAIALVQSILQQNRIKHVASLESSRLITPSTTASVTSRSKHKVEGLDVASSAKPSIETPSTLGVYLWGSVGAGKTMLMDMLMDTMPDRLDAGGDLGSIPFDKRRLHYHEFMMGVHCRLHELQLSLPRMVTRSRQGLPVYRHAIPEEDPVATVGREIAASAALLCLDELHVTDVADAMLLSRLFSTITASGTACAFTSNRPPQDLYKGGLNRQYFLPFVNMLQERFAVIKVGSGKDYRLQAGTTATPGLAADKQRSADGAEAGTVAAPPCEAATVEAGVELTSISEQRLRAVRARSSTGTMFVGGAAAVQLRHHWEQLCSGRPSVEGEVTVGYGRALWVPEALAAADAQNGCSTSTPHPAAYFTFQQLCGRQGLRRGVDDGGALAAPDYLALARAFPTLFLQGLQQLGSDHRDEARRLITVIDVLYEAGTTLYCSSNCQPAAMFLPLLAAAQQLGVNASLGRHTKLSPIELEAVKVAAAPASASEGGTSRAMWAEEVLMYHRAASRLQEMCRVVMC